MSRFNRRIPSRAPRTHREVFSRIMDEDDDASISSYKKATSNVVSYLDLRKYEKKTKDLQREVENLTDQKVRLKEDNDLGEQMKVMEEENGVLAEQKRLLEQKNETLEIRLEEEKRLLKEENGTLSRKKKALKEEKIILEEQLKALKEDNRVLAEQKILYKKTIDDLSTEFHNKTEHLVQKAESLDERRRWAEDQLERYKKSNIESKEKVIAINESHNQLERAYNKLCQESSHMIDILEHKRQISQLKTEKNTEIKRLAKENNSLRSRLYIAECENGRFPVGSSTPNRTVHAKNIRNSTAGSSRGSKESVGSVDSHWKEMKMNEMNQLKELKKMLRSKEALVDQLSNIVSR